MLGKSATLTVKLATIYYQITMAETIPFARIHRTSHQWQIKEVNYW